MDCSTLQKIYRPLMWLTGALLLGCDGASQSTLPTPPPADLADTSALRPPMLVVIERDGESVASLSPPAPEIRYRLSIPEPVLQPIESMELIDPADADMVADVEEEPRSTSTSVSALHVADLLNSPREPANLVRTTWGAGESLHGAQIPTPVLVATGSSPGPTLCITAAVHGDELNGIESVRRVMHSLKPQRLSGTVIGVPIVNLQGFQRHSRYLPDRRDLNRFFPGNARGSAASRMAHSFFNDIIRHCDGLVDLHTGSFHRTNLPQLRADLNREEVLNLTQGFGSTVILHSDGAVGTLRRAAVEAGIPAVTLEAGEPLRLQESAVDHTVKAIFTLLDTMQMYNKRSLWGNPEPTYYSSMWVRSDQGGILLSEVKLGHRVKPGERLGTVTDPISNEQQVISAPYEGRIIGMALNQFVMPGFATFHLATQTPIDEASDSESEHADNLDVAMTESLADDKAE